MDIKKDNCVEAFRLLGLTDSSAFFGDYGQKGPFKAIEEGSIGPNEFHAKVREILPQQVTDAEIDAAFMKFLIGIPVERLRQLQALRHKYGVYLLSNTNPIMWNAKIADDFKVDGLTIDSYFDGIVTSFEAKALKPAAKIFLHAAEKFGIKPEETIFFDDSEENVKAAEALGFKGAHVAPGKEFYDIISELNLA